MEFSWILVFFITIFLSMLPIIEIRGALPLGMSVSLWGSGALSSLNAWLACLIGGILACFVSVAVFLPLRKTLSRFKFFNKIFERCDKTVLIWFDKFQARRKARKQHKEAKLSKKYAHKKPKENSKIEPSPTKPTTITFAPLPQKAQPKQKDKTIFLKSSIVFLFCAIPLPFSGVWSAGALCSILKLPFVPSVIVLILANLLCSVVVGAFCLLFQPFIDLVILIMVLILVFVILQYFFNFLYNKRQLKHCNKSSKNVEF